jgi:hypothetical protein
MPRMTSMVLGAGLALTLVASIACGSKKTEETPKASTTTVAATATAKAAAATAAATAAAKAGGGAGLPAGSVAAAICSNWKTVAAAGPGMGMPSGAPTGAMPTMPNLAGSEAMMKQMVDNAPNELKADFAVFAKYFTEYSAAMTRANGDFMKLAQDPAFVKMMESGTTEVEAAAKNIETWTTKNC